MRGTALENRAPGTDAELAIDLASAITPIQLCSNKGFVEVERLEILREGLRLD